MAELIRLWMFVALFPLVFAGIPVALSLVIVATGFGLTVFGDSLFLQLYGSILQTASNFTLSAIPLFIMMGALLEQTGLALRLFKALQLWMGRFPGGLALSTITMCAIFAAASGVVGAVEIVVGMMALPAMAKYRSTQRLMSGTPLLRGLTVYNHSPLDCSGGLLIDGATVDRTTVCRQCDPGDADGYTFYPVHPHRLSHQ